MRADQVLNLAIEHVVAEHIKLLQEKSMTNEDRREALRQKYIFQRGPISKDGFLGLLLTPEFQQFLSEQAATGECHNSGSTVVANAG